MWELISLQMCCNWKQPTEDHRDVELAATDLWLVNESFYIFFLKTIMEMLFERGLDHYAKEG